MIRIVDDARTQIRRFTCSICGTEFVADFEEANKYTGFLECPICRASKSWTIGDIVYDEEEKG